MAKVYFYDHSGTITVIANAQGQPYFCNNCPCQKDNGIKLFADTVKVSLTNDYSIDPNDFPERNWGNRKSLLPYKTFNIQTYGDASSNVSAFTYLQDDNKSEVFYDNSIATHKNIPIESNTISVAATNELGFNTDNKRRYVSGVASSQTYDDYTNINNTNLVFNISQVNEPTFITSIDYSNTNDFEKDSIFTVSQTKLKNISSNKLSAQIVNNKMWNNVTYVVDRIVSGVTEGYTYHKIGSTDDYKFYIGKIYEVEENDEIKRIFFFYPQYDGSSYKLPLYPAISASDSSYTFYNGNTIDNCNYNNNLKFRTWNWNYHISTIPSGTSGLVNGSTVTRITPTSDSDYVDSTDYTASGKQLYGGIPLSSMIEEDILTCQISTVYAWKPFMELLPKNTSGIIATVKRNITGNQNRSVEQIYISGVCNGHSIDNHTNFENNVIDWFYWEELGEKTKDYFILPAKTSGYPITGYLNGEPQYSSDLVAITNTTSAQITSPYASGVCNGCNLHLDDLLSGATEVFAISTLYSGYLNGLYEVLKSYNYSYFKTRSDLISYNPFKVSDVDVAFKNIVSSAFTTGWFTYDGDYIYKITDNTTNWRATQINVSSPKTFTIPRTTPDTAPPPYWYTSALLTAFPIFSSYYYSPASNNNYIVRVNYFDNLYGYRIDTVNDKKYYNDNRNVTVMERMTEPYYQDLDKLWSLQDTIFIDFECDNPTTTKVSGYFKNGYNNISNDDPYIFSKQPFLVKHKEYDHQYQQTATQYGGGWIERTSLYNLGGDTRSIKLSLPTGVMSRLNNYKGVECLIITSVYLAVDDSFMWTPSRTTIPAYTSGWFNDDLIQLAGSTSRTVTNINTNVDPPTGQVTAPNNTNYTLISGHYYLIPPYTIDNTKYKDHGFRHFGSLTGVMELNKHYSFSFNTFNLGFLDFDDIKSFISHKNNNATITMENLTVGQLSAVMTNNYEHRDDGSMLVSVAIIRPLRLVTTLPTNNACDAFLTNATITAKLNSATNIKNITLKPGTVSTFRYVHN